MASIFHKVADGWVPLPVPSTRVLLSLAPVRVDPLANEGWAGHADSLLTRVEPDRPWILLPRHGRRLLHNGELVALGIRVLAHMDSLALEGGEAVFLSTEERAHIEPFAGQRAITCARCRSPIRPGQPTVKCPGCGVFHHELEDRGCWSYTATCAVCAQNTALDGELQWTPAAL